MRIVNSVPGLGSVTVYFGGKAGQESLRLESRAVGHPQFDEAIRNIFSGHKEHLSRNVKGDHGGATGYVHIPRTHNRDLLGFSDVDEKNKTIIIRSTGYTKNGTHIFNTKGEY